MADDDFFDDEAADFGEPVHPDDRLWRHPSEMANVPPPGARSIPDTVDFAPVPARRQAWGALAVAGLAGAAVAVSVIMMTSLGNHLVDEQAGATSPTTPVSPLVPTSTTASTTTTSTIAVEPPNDLSQAAASAAPSMAWITVTNEAGTTNCAGLVVRSDGHLVTDSSLFSDEAVITVRFHDGSAAVGELVGIDPLTELAVVRVDRNNLTPAVLGDPRRLRAGEPVLLLAPNPTGGAAAHTAMVNAVGTPATIDDGTTLYDMIQFDVQVPTTISGGPLLDTDGKVVGVTVRSDGGTPFGLATPIDSASLVIDDLITRGRASHPWLGVEVGQNGAEPLIISVVPEGPAHLGGLIPGDIILAVDGDPVPSMEAFVTMIRARRPGDEVAITYRRHLETEPVSTDCIVVLGER